MKGYVIINYSDYLLEPNLLYDEEGHIKIFKSLSDAAQEADEIERAKIVSLP